MFRWYVSFYVFRTLRFSFRTFRFVSVARFVLWIIHIDDAPFVAIRSIPIIIVSFSDTGEAVIKFTYPIVLAEWYDNLPFGYINDAPFTITQLYYSDISVLRVFLDLAHIIFWLFG